MRGIFESSGFLRSWIGGLPINKPNQVPNPEGFFGISTVYKKFCLRPICQHVLAPQEAFLLARHERNRPAGRQASVSGKIFHALRRQPDVELNSYFVFGSDARFSGRLDPEIGLLHDDLAGVPAVL